VSTPTFSSRRQSGRRTFRCRPILRQHFGLSLGFAVKNLVFFLVSVSNVYLASLVGWLNRYHWQLEVRIFVSGAKRFENKNRVNYVKTELGNLVSVLRRGDDCDVKNLSQGRQHVDGRHMLRAVRRSHDHSHTVLRHVQTTLPRKGMNLDILEYIVM